MYRWMAVGLIIALNSVSVAQAQSRGPMLWTISGAGAGFGIGLWAGLSAFDDAVNSDRKVWTSAIVGAGVGAVAGYLIGRARTGRNRPSTTATSSTGNDRRRSTRGCLSSWRSRSGSTEAVYGARRRFSGRRSHNR